MDQAAYNDQYQRENIKRIVVKLNRKTQSDLIDHIETKDNVQGYIISLIRRDLEENN